MARTLAAEYEDLFANLRMAGVEPSAALQRLQELLGERGVDVERVRARLETQLKSESARIVTDLLQHGPQEFKDRIESFGLPAQEVFGQRIQGIRELYLDDAVRRIQGEEDDLKAAFLKKLTEWAENGGELDVSDLISQMQETSVHRARFFARDQFSKFNRSVTVASYQSAEVKYYEWLTSNDVRVRDSHKARNHKMYTLEELLADPEYHSYNCRCSYVPHWNLTAEQEERRIPMSMIIGGAA